jgi:hypothetical protein
MCRAFQLPDFRRPDGEYPAVECRETGSIWKTYLFQEKKTRVSYGARANARAPSTTAGRMPMSYSSDFSIQEPPHPSLTHA